MRNSLQVLVVILLLTFCTVDPNTLKELISAAATGALVKTPAWNTNPLSKPATDLHEASARESKVALGDEGSMPELSGAIGWLNSRGPIVDRIFEIEFLDPDVQALDFTFG